ncbi:MAG: hypothetical protein JEZ06_20360 [Anaerolineaceae bacterium]|nr:hypothetical protein [Anaerolineaceae bacterium]
MSIQRVFLAVYLLLPTLSPGINLDPVVSIELTKPQVTNVNASYTFDDSIALSANILNYEEVQGVTLFIQAEKQNLYNKEIILTEPSEISSRIPISELQIQPFSRVYYWFQIDCINGTTVTSEKFELDYIDNRFEWNKVSDSDFIIHWIGNREGINLKALDLAQSASLEIQNNLNLKSNHLIQIFIYDNKKTLQEAIHIIHTDWVGGQAILENNVILLSIPFSSDDLDEFDRQIKHELTHILLYQNSGSYLYYLNIPFWLNEGLAGLNENISNPAYNKALEDAVNNDQLIPIEDLIRSFPQSDKEITLAYAESISFTKYIFHNYGYEGLQNLLLQLKNGKDCQESIQSGLSTTLEKLEYDWQQSELNIHPENKLISNIFPYLLFGLLIIATPIIISLITQTNKKS